MNAHELLPKTELNCPKGLELVFLGGGCFWCTEAVFLRLEGVKEVVEALTTEVVVAEAHTNRREALVASNNNSQPTSLMEYFPIKTSSSSTSKNSRSNKTHRLSL